MRSLFAVVAFLCSWTTLAAVGLTQIPGVDGDGPVTVFYPSSGEAREVKRGPFTIPVAENGAPQRGNGRLVILSHGSGSSPWVHSDLARVVVEAGFVVAMPRHRGDNHVDGSAPGPDSWQRRPAEVSRAIDAVARDARFALLVAVDKVGVYGISAGGHTALSLAGGRWSPAMVVQHCRAHIDSDFPACAGLAAELQEDGFDWLRKWVVLRVLSWRFSDPDWRTHRDPRVRAVAAGVPYAADFDLQSLATPRVPLGLVNAGKDKWLAPRYHAGAVLKACKSCELIADLPEGGHGALASPLPPNPPPRLAALIADPPGFDRRILPEVDRKIAAFFAKHLLP